MEFGEVLKQAWKIIWKHKILWVFGIFAGCARGGGGNGGGGGSGQYNAPGNGPSGQNPFPQAERYMTQFGDWVTSHIWVVVLVVLAILVLAALSIFLGTIGRIGLIKGASKADAGAERLGFGELWRESLPYFWRVFGLSFLLGLAFLVLIVPAVLIGVLTQGVGFLCLLPLICILVPVAIVASLVVVQAETAMVLENLGIKDGALRGWQVFRRNLGPVLIMWLILAVIGFIVGIVVALPVLIVVVPAAIVFFANGAHTTGAALTPLIIAGLCLVAYLPVTLVLNGVLTAYLQSAWTLTFLRLTKPKDNLESPVIPSPNA